MNGIDRLKALFPILQYLSSYDRPSFRKDVFAGLTVGVILIPQGMAYAMLAGVPPIYGLYAGLVPLLIYALLGTSKQLSVGPVAISALLVLAGISSIAEPFSVEYIQYAILAGLLIGVAQMLMGVLRLGILVNFLSHPVIVGFSSAAAFIIIISQLDDILGFSVEARGLLPSLSYVASHIAQVHWLTFFICMASFVILLLMKAWKPKVPSALIVVILATIASKLLHWEEAGLAVIGNIPSGLPGFIIPEFSVENIKAVLPTVFTVAIIGTVECISIAKVLESKTKDHIVRPNTELIAIGISKIAGGFFQAMPSSGSFSRSAVNNESKAASQVSSIITFSLMALTLVFLTPLFHWMPKAVLAAIILQSVLGLFEWKEAKHLWEVHRSDFAMMLATFSITLLLGIEVGVFSGVILSVGAILYNSTRPHVAELGNIPETPYYRNVDRFTNDTTINERILILRFDDQLYFGNCDYFKTFVRDQVDRRGTELTHVLLDCANIHAMDSSGAHALHDIETYLADMNIEIHLAAAHGPLRDMLAKCGMMKELQKHHMTVHAGMQAIEGSEELKARKSAIQRNI